MKKILRQLEKSKKNQVCFFWISMSVLVCVYVFLMWYKFSMIDKKEVIQETASFEPDFLYSVIGCLEEEEVYIIDGWAKRGNSEIKSLQFMLQENNNAVIVLEENSYEENTGAFSSAIEKEKLKEGECYEVYILSSYKSTAQNNSLYWEKTFTNKYMYEGKLYNYNPLEVEFPEIIELRNDMYLFEDNLKLFDINERIWMYEREGKRYWLVELSEYKNLNEVLSIAVHYYALENESLPKENREEGYVRKDFFLQDAELYTNGEKQYALIIDDNTQDFSVSYIEWGLYGHREVGWINRHSRLLSD